MQLVDTMIDFQYKYFHLLITNQSRLKENWLTMIRKCIVFTLDLFVKM